MITVYVPGDPIPQGSMRSFVGKHSGRVVTLHSNARLKLWREKVACAMRVAWGKPPVKGAIALTCDFRLRRPKSVTRDRVIVPPDLDKLLRAICDAGTGAVWVDDAQIVIMSGTKNYADIGMPAGVTVTVTML